jgi:hypothetical protein
MPARDTHRQRIYDAEQATCALQFRSAFTLAQAKRWLARFVRSTWARKRWGKAVRHVPLYLNPKLVEWGGQANAMGIELASFSFDHPYIVIHELAHVIADRIKPSQAGHGPLWLGIVRELIGHYIGEDALDEFDEELSARHVPIR